MLSLHPLTAGSFLALAVSAMPNPHPSITARGPISRASTGSGATVTNFDRGNFSVPASALAAESSAYDSWTSEFFKTASPSKLSAVAAYDAQESALYASWSAEEYRTLAPSESSLIAAEYANWTVTAGLAVPATSTSSSIDTAAAAAATWKPLAQSLDPSWGGITCQTQSGVRGATTVNTSACAVAASNACRKLNESRTGAYFWDQWVWSGGGPGSENLEQNMGCCTAYWLPKSLVQDPGVSNPLVPPVEQCMQDFYAAMVETCIGPYNAASVNVAVLPDGKGSTGQQVDSGRVSYLLAPSVWPCDYGCSD